MSNKIIHPSIDVFIYDLAESLGQDRDSEKDKYQNFCKKIYGDLNQADFDIECKKVVKCGDQPSDDTDYPVYLLDNKTKKFAPPLDGYYYPLKIGDTLALQLCYSGRLGTDNKPNYQVQNLEESPFLKLRQETENLTFNSTATLGQTRIFWGKVVTKTDSAEVINIARDCYTQIENDLNWEKDLIGNGKHLGGDIIELYHRSEKPDTFGKSHVIIWLFPYDLSDEDIEQNVNSTHEDFMYLFQYRHKILRSYDKCTSLKKDLKEQYRQIHPSIQNVGKLSKQLKNGTLNLESLQDTLVKNLANLSEYTSFINSLYIQSTTIETNSDNYKIRFKSMEQKYSDSDLAFFGIFVESDVYVKKYKKHLEMQLLTFNPGLKVLENLNSTLQGIIDIERTKSQRDLDNKLAIVGSGLAFSSVVATAIAEQGSESKDYLWNGEFIDLFSTPVFVGSSVSTIILIATLLVFKPLISRIFKRAK